ncbi:MAG TPA: hypothetical protein VIM53_00690 [Candidatus Saccharimonadales bacterium]
MVTKIKNQTLRRAAYFVAACAALLIVTLPNVANRAFAAQVTTRSIKISNSAVSASGVTYLFTFTAPTATKSMVIDFCMNSPIIGGSCTTTSDVNAASATFTNVTNMSTWSLGSAAATTVKLTSATATTAGQTLSFSLNTVTNPTVNGSFYARVYTYTNADYESTGTAYSSPTSIGTNNDYGGFALSTANTIGITATVMETLTFCVSGATMTAGCTGMTTPTLVLGHGSPQVIDSTATDTATAYTQISTNAQSGVVVRMQNSNSCGGLSRNGGSTCDIVAANSGAATAPTGTIAAGTAAFGMYATPGSGLTAANPYASGGSTYYGMDTTGGTGVTSTYGSQVMSSSTVLNSINSTLTFGASAATTTPAGVYTATMTLICTGTF